MFVLGGSRGRQSLTVEALTEGWGEEEEEKKEVEEEATHSPFLSTAVLPTNIRAMGGQ